MINHDITMCSYIQLNESAMISLAPVCAHSPCAISKRSGFKDNSFSRADRAAFLPTKLARHSRRVREAVKGDSGSLGNIQRLSKLLEHPFSIARDSRVGALALSTC